MRAFMCVSVCECAITCCMACSRADELLFGILLSADASFDVVVVTVQSTICKHVRL